MSEEEKIKCQDLLTLLEEAKDKVKEAGLHCDTIQMSPKIYDLVVARIEDLSGEKEPISNITFSGLKLVKNKHLPENTVLLSQQGKLKRVETWDLKGLEDNGNDRKTEKKNEEKEPA